MRFLHDVLDTAAATRPDRPALRAPGCALTHHELRERSLGLAGWLASLGVRRGDRIVVQASNHTDTAALLYAASRLGAIFTCLHPAVQPYQLRHVLADCDPAVVIAGAECQDVARASSPAPVKVLQDLQTRALAAPDPGPARPDDPACLIYTSGSTAMPKAVVSPHRQMLFAARAIQARLGYTAADTVFCALPLSFDYGLYQVLLCGLAGAELVLGDARDVGPTLLATLVRERISVAPLVPTLAGTLARLLGRGGPPPARLRLLTNTGAAMPAPTLARLRAGLPAVAVQLMFGLTECKRVSIMEPDGDLTRPGSSGRPLDGTEAYAADQAGRPLPPGQTGQLIVRGPHVMAGYWRAPDLTSRRFFTGAGGTRSLATGDLAWFDADGYLYFAGRDDDLYKNRGLRVAAAEVEAAALDVPGVTDAALLPPDHSHPPRLAVTGHVQPAQVLKELATRLEDYKVPAACHVVAALPVTAHGKTDKKALRARLGEVSP